MKQEDIRVRCTQCGHVHLESERVRRDEADYEKKGHTVMVCPECKHDTWRQE